MADSMIAKITCPDVLNTVERYRVFSLLENACKKAVIWISAPAGSGKTTLVAGFLKARQISCLWYQTDAGDSDMISFFYYMGLAVNNSLPGVNKPLPDLTPECLHNVKPFARRYFEKLFIRVQETNERPFCLALDNYQQIPGNSEFHGIMANTLAAVPQGVNVIVISRQPPPAPYARLRANNQLAILTLDDIRFSFSETRAFIRESIPKSIPPTHFKKTQTVNKHPNAKAGDALPDYDNTDAVAKLLHTATDGWAAGLVLLAEQFICGKADPDFPSEADLPETITDYFAEEVCKPLDAETLDFLIQTSFLPKMSPYTAETISGNPDADSILMELHRRNYFTEIRTRQPRVYQYLPLFRTFLQCRAKKHFSGKEYLTLQQKAASLLVKAGEINDAIALLLAASDYKAAIPLIFQQAPVLIDNGMEKTLESWLERLPDTLCSMMPWVFYWKGICRYAFTPDIARRYFQCAFSHFRDKNDDAGLLSSWSGIVGTILLERENLLQLKTWVQWIDDRTKNGLQFPSRDVETKVVASMVSILCFSNTGHPRSGEWLTRAAQLVEEDPGFQSNMLPSCLIMYYLVIGEISAAGLLIKKLNPFVTSSTSPLLRIQWSLLEAMYAHMGEGKGEEAIRQAEKGLSLAEKTGIHVFDPSLLAQGVHGALTAYDMKKADSFLKSMANTLKETNLWDISSYHFLYSWKSLCEGCVRESREHIQLAMNMALNIGCPFSRAIGYMGMAHALIEMKDAKAAEHHISMAEKIIPGKGGNFKFMVHITRALISFQKDDTAEGTRLLEKALSLGRKQAYFTAPFWRRETMGMLCALALEHNTEPDYVQEMIKKRNLHPLPTLPNHQNIYVENWPYPLRIYTLGRFEIEIQDKPLALAGRIQKKPLDMLKNLIALGCKDVPMQNITDILYPDADGDRATYSFKYTLHQLRKLLGPGLFLLLQSGRLSLDMRYCYTDFEAFFHLAAQLQKLHVVPKSLHETITRNDSRTELISQLCQKLISLYSGDFLKNDDFECVVAAREKIRKKFLELFDLTGAYFENIGKNHEAIVLYEKAIETDERQERFYRGLIRCHGNIGQVADALLAYERCCAVLSSRLGSKPSPETIAAYKFLTTV